MDDFEKKIAEQIRTKVAEQQLEDVIDEVLVPTEEVIEVRRGKTGHRVRGDEPICFDLQLLHVPAQTWMDIRVPD